MKLAVAARTRALQICILAASVVSIRPVIGSQPAGTLELNPLAAAPQTSHSERAPRNAEEWDALRQRLRAGKLSAVELDSLVTLCISNLKADDLDWNALEAMDSLATLGSRAIGPLEAALNSTDYQQRQLAAHMLRRIDEVHYDRHDGTPSPVRTSPEIIRVTIEGLQNDALPSDPKQHKNVEAANAHSGFIVLVRHYDASKAGLLAAAESKDPQQRFLAAAIIGLSRDTSATTLVAPTLAEHLGTNDIEGDSRLAVAALCALGPGVVPALIGYLNDEDPQRSAATRIICKDLTHSAWLAQDKAELNRISKLVHRPSELQYLTLEQLLDGLRFP